MITGLLKFLEKESESAVNWFKQNEMIANAVKFQAIILNKKESEAKDKLTIDNNDTESTKFVKLFGITIDDQLRFDQHILYLYSKSTMQLNALGRLQKKWENLKKVAILKSFLCTNCNYCPLVLNFSACKSIRKIEKMHCLRIVIDDFDNDYNDHEK